MSLPLSSIVLGGFTNGNSYYAINDLTWSLQYSICGQSGAQAGICTALYTGDMAAANGSLLGGPGKALGCAPSEDFNSITATGITQPILTIAIDSLGAYALTDALLPGTADLYTNGDSTSGLNVDVLTRGTYITVRDSNFFIVGSVPVDYNVVSTTQQFKTLRFQLTNGGNKLIVSTLDSQNAYTDLASFDVNLSPALTDQYKVGIAYASPLVNNDLPPARFDVQRYHVQGADVAPVSVSLTEPLQILSLPFVNPVSLSIAPTFSATAADIPVLPQPTFASLTAIAASASYIDLSPALSAFVTNNTDTKQVITYDNNINI